MKSVTNDSTIFTIFHRGDRRVIILCHSNSPAAHTPTREPVAFTRTMGRSSEGEAEQYVDMGPSGTCSTQYFPRITPLSDHPTLAV
jgi:hypothetical protein